MLIDNQHLTVQDLAERLELSARSVYRYIQFCENIGFDVYNDHGIFSVGHNSPFISAVSKKAHFTSEELEKLGTLLSRADNKDAVVNKLKYKFRNVYGMDFRKEEFTFDKRFSENIDELKKAIAGRRQCVLQKYNSLNSKDIRDRLVEPFQFLNDSNEVRCYEVESGICKTFKVARIKGRVVCGQNRWEHREKHISYFTDLFGFTAEKVSKVILRLTTVSKTILMEEFGLDESRFVMEDNDHFLVHLPVCNMKGIGRFVMGLIDEVEIIRGDSLRAYVREKLNASRI